MLGALGAAACAAGTPNTDRATVLYTPVAGYGGSDSFTFQVNDGTNDAPVAGTVSITVNAPAVPTATTTPAVPTATPTPAGPTPTATGPTPAPGLCGDAPRSGCRTPVQPQGALLTIKKGSDASKDRLLWKWGKGAATAKGDFGIPTETTDYELCLYDGNDRLLLGARAPKGDVCRTNEIRNCWEENAKGFRYVDRDLTPDGLQQMSLKAGSAGKAQILVRGRGNNLQAPPLSIMNLPVRVQLVNGGGACWEATFSATFQNTAERFKAKSD